MNLLIESQYKQVKGNKIDNLKVDEKLGSSVTIASPSP